MAKQRRKSPRGLDIAGVSARKRRMEALLDALLVSQLKEQTADYLSRGRPYSTERAEDVETAWTAAFKRSVGTRTPEAQRDVDDLAAELRLRGVEPPYEAVQPELDAVREHVSEAGHKDPGARE
jgi:hypothetical protein